MNSNVPITPSVDQQQRSTFPVALFLWQRPENTRIILKAIEQYGPEKLLVVADGPRNEDDQQNIAAVLDEVRALEDRCSFPVLLNTTDAHLGLKKRFVSGFEWIFSHIEEEVIILEDDTLPSPSFFEFCTAGLRHFRHDHTIVSINGSFRLKNNNNLHQKIKAPFLSGIFCAWGWATWKSKFRPLYNADMKDLKIWQKLYALSRLRNYNLYQKRYAVLKRIIAGTLDTWDVQLQWNILLAGKNVLLPPVNLIYNNGLDHLAATQQENYNNLLFNPSAELKVDSRLFAEKPRYTRSYDVAVYQASSNIKAILQLIKERIEHWTNHIAYNNNISHFIAGSLRELLYRLIILRSASDRKPLINLVIAGEQKCGTSSLHELLRSHPAIAGGHTKEKQLFNNPSLFDESGIIKKKSVIIRQFAVKEMLLRPSKRYYLDSTPDYLFSKEALARIALYNPACKIVYMMRDPVKRFISSYHFYFHTAKYRSPFFTFDPDGRRMESTYRENPNTSFRDYFELETGPEPVFKALERGLYHENSLRILALFNPAQVHLLHFESLCNSKEAKSALKGLSHFIGIENLSDSFPHMHQSKKQASGPEQWHIDWLYEYYVEDQKKLKDLCLKYYPVQFS